MSLVNPKSAIFTTPSPHTKTLRAAKSRCTNFFCARYSYTKKSKMSMLQNVWFNIIYYYSKLCGPMILEKFSSLPAKSKPSIKSAIIMAGEIKQQNVGRSLSWLVRLPVYWLQGLCATGVLRPACNWEQLGAVIAASPLTHPLSCQSSQRNKRVIRPSDFNQHFNRADNDVWR